MTLNTAEEQTMRTNRFAPNPDRKIWMNNELVPADQAAISVYDHGLLYGDGVFEGIRIYGGKIFEEKKHVKRFFESGRAIRLDIPMQPQQVSEAMYAAMDANGITGDGYIRLVCTRGVGLLGISIAQTDCPTVFVIADTISLYPKEVYQRGLHCIISSYVRNHPNSISPRVKSLNYLNNILAKAEAREAGADEAVMLNIYGRVCECTGDNIFIVRNNVVMTPLASECILDGITRGVVIQLAKKRGLEVLETTLLRHDLLIADECFATGTAAEIVPITQIEGRCIGDGNPGPITKQLWDDFIAYRS